MLRQLGEVVVVGRWQMRTHPHASIICMHLWGQLLWWQPVHECEGCAGHARRQREQVTGAAYRVGRRWRRRRRGLPGRLLLLLLPRLVLLLRSVLLLLLLVGRGLLRFTRVHRLGDEELLWAGCSRRRRGASDSEQEPEA